MTIDSNMRAVMIGEGGGSACLQLVETAVPDIGEGDVLIKVAASGINRPDILQRDGLYPAPKGHSSIIGLEVAGEIVKLGVKAKKFAIGDKVTALVNGGANADYCAASEGSVLAVPQSLSMAEAAGIPETFFTVWHNVFERGRLEAGEWLLVHGGSSGIGTTAIQLAKAKGSKVIVTAGSDEKCAACTALGATGAINYNTQDFVEEVKALTDKRGADVILDMVGGEYIQRNIEAAATEGRIVQIAFLQGAKREVNFMRLMLKRLTLTGSTLRMRSDGFKASVAEKLKAHVWPLIESGEIKPVIAATFPLEEIKQAHELMESSAHVGKIILTH